MAIELYKRTLYTKKVQYIINEIHEYDISKAKQKIEEMLIQTWEKELDMLNAFLN